MQIDDIIPCRIRPTSLYNGVYTMIQVTLLAVVVPLLMAIFSSLTVYNATRKSTYSDASHTNRYAYFTVYASVYHISNEFLSS